MNIDPVILEILSNKVTSITEEAGFTIRRIGHTLFVKEVSDFGTALADLNGKFFAYPKAIGVTSFIDLDCGPTIRAVPDLAPGDVIITNHSYASDGLATHTPDVHLVVPYFHEGELVCFGWSFLHISDMGGKVPGSVSPSSTDVFQEGVLIPPMKLCIGGEFNPDVIAILNSNSRTPEANLGDIKAMLAAHTVAQRRVEEIIEQHGVEVFKQCQAELIEYSRLRAREVLRRIPDGEYQFWDYLDDDLLSNIPLRLCVNMIVRDGFVTLDFSGTDPQTLAAYNVVTKGRRHPWLTLRIIGLVCTYDKDIPFNAGMFDNVDVKVPLGSVINPEFPAAVGVRHATAVRVSDVVHGALYRAAGSVVPACAAGIVIPIVFAEPGTTGGQRNVLVVELMIGGMGGRHGLDGVDGRGSSLSSMSNNPIEMVEGSAAIAIRNFSMRTDSAGAGQWRGGSGLALTFEALRDGCSVLGRGMERFRFRPWGVAGGEPGQRARTILNLGRADERELGKIDMVTLNRGETFTVLTPGGGGFGDPFQRDVAAVESDVMIGLVSREAARSSYGVVFSGDEVDHAATEQLRGERPPADAQAFGFDPQRLAWESLFSQSVMQQVNQALFELPLHDRSERRRQFFQYVVPGLEERGRDLDELIGDPEACRARLSSALASLQENAAQQDLVNQPVLEGAPSGKEDRHNWKETMQ